MKSLAVGALTESFVCGEDDARTLVKRLNRHLAHDPDCVAMVCHEARVLGALDHPNIVRLVSGPREVGGLWEFEEEFVAGGSLAERIASGARYDVPKACDLVSELLSALDHLHTRTLDGEALSIVHRDVCPSNLMLSPTSVVLVDFGISTSIWRHDPDRGRMKGTRGYWSPEVVTGERDADARSDLFAAGVILYELTVGRRLYNGPTMRVMAAIADGDLPSPALEVKGFPSAIDAVIRRALARDPDQRFESAKEMQAALNAARP